MSHKDITHTNNRPLIGIVEWFQYEDYEHVDRVLRDLKKLRVETLRTGFSWADWHRPDSLEWFDFLIPTLAQEVDILPCFLYTPPSIGEIPKTQSPPRNLQDYGDWLEKMIGRYGEYFDWVELWNEPNNLSEWDWTLDPGWLKYSEMVEYAAEIAHRKDKKVAMGGMSPIDPNWLDMIGERGTLMHFDAIGLHGFPGTWEAAWVGWEESIGEVRKVLQKYGCNAQIWITETGYSTWRHDPAEQVNAFLNVLSAPASRVYWYAFKDLDPQLPTVEGFHLDEREYHFGIHYADGTPKLLFRLGTKKGLAAVKEVASLIEPANALADLQGHIVVTGGAGFVGTNLVNRLLERDETVLVYDSLHRPGVEDNLRWLKERHGDRLHVRLSDVRDRYSLRDAVSGSKQVYHLAGQTAVTTSLDTPERDFDINLRGTLNLLEILRDLDNPPVLLFTSTNKVYGNLSGVKLRQNGKIYEPVDETLRRHGIDERQPLEFHSPYGCSKGAADQYILDYARNYGLEAVVFRMSCIYGPHQFGTEDQGWVAHFLLQAIKNEPITIFGDGRQVRDVLFVDDLVGAMLQVAPNIEHLAGQAYNIGGGPEHAISLLQLVGQIERLQETSPQVYFDAWRPGDQRYYVSDTRRFQRATGWQPAVDPVQGVEKLYDWLRENRNPQAEAAAAALENLR